VRISAFNSRENVVTALERVAAALKQSVCSDNRIRENCSRPR
jgi:hypothetical protein